MNNVTFNVSSMALRNVESGGHYFWLIAELWIYDPASGTIYYDNRYVDLVLNLKR
jgi:SPX domain protein involved in polyphosphate accumulation